MATSSHNSSNPSKSVFNPSDFIDSNYISKSEADTRYINSNQNLENLIGSLNITGDETVTNQYVTGNSTVGGSSFVTGDSVISGVIRAGVANNTGKDSVIYGNVTLGDQNSASNTTKVYMLGENIIGLTKPTKINGDVTINTDTTWGSNTSIGKSSTTTTINGTVNIGAQNNTATIEGNVNIGNDSKTTIIKGTTVTVGTVNTTSTLNGNVNIGDDSKTTQIKGGTIAIGNGSSTGIIQIGKGALTADVANGQINTFVSSQNRIFNPRICDNYGALTTQNFNLNSPTYFVFSKSATFATGQSSATLPNVTGAVVFLNTPDLTNFMVYPIGLELFYYLVTSGGNSNTLSTVAANALTSNTSLNAGASGSRSMFAQLTLLIIKGGGGNTSTGYTFNYVPMNYSGPSSNGPFANITWGTSGTTATASPPFTITATASNKLRIQIGYPNYTQTTLSSTVFAPVAVGASVRIINSAPASTSTNTAVYPSNSTDSNAGGCWLSLS